MRQQLMPVKTIEGENAIEQIFCKLNNHTHGGVFIVGEYGSGKTYLTYLLIKLILENPNQYAFYPLWFKLIDREIDLKCGNIEVEAERFINLGLKKYSNLPDDISFGGRKKLLIILDGFDEIVAGLGESGKKVQFLQKVCEGFSMKYSYCNIRFLVTTREMDYSACKKNRDFPDYLRRFGKVILGECNEDDVRKGILDIKQPFYDEDHLDKLKNISQNECLVNIARKPLYFGFLRDLIISSDYSEYKDELEILDAIILKSVHRYVDSGQNEDEILNMLYIYAIDISKQLARGQSDSIEIIKSFVSQNIGKNVLQLKRVNSDHYQVRFYHNVIREYLVAKRLFQESLNCFIYENKLVSDNLFNWMEELDMTPETMDFFCAFVKKKDDKYFRIREGIVAGLSGMLKSACEPSKEKLGTHVLSMLLRLQPELSNYNFERIHAGNMYLWNCSLTNIDLKNAKLTNCTLFNMQLNSVDFRDADLSGLVMNSENEILDVCHYVKNSELTVTVLYSTGQLIDYYFSDKNNLEQYIIKNRATVPDQNYKKFISFDDSMLIYSEKKIYSIIESQIVYKMKSENQLLHLDKQYAIVKIDGALYIVLHNKKYHQRHISGILQADYNTVCVVDWNMYLIVRNRRLILIGNDEIIPIMDLNASYECFTARKKIGKDILCIYVKYKDIIQIILYDIKRRKIKSSPLKLAKMFSCKKLVSVSESVLYGIADDIIYIFNPLVENSDLTKLQTRVICKNLILENEDGSQRVMGEEEYITLKEACDSARQSENIKVI
ncbi:MAG: pentapeptide repeat-containing protein [Lachnospiraceae bacterium]|nr:pentapeptide repeat-containing protein [Lachnospiraceae bacterium]